MGALSCLAGPGLFVCQRVCHLGNTNEKKQPARFEQLVRCNADSVRHCQPCTGKRERLVYECCDRDYPTSPVCKLQTAIATCHKHLQRGACHRWRERYAPSVTGVNKQTEQLERGSVYQLKRRRRPRTLDPGRLGGRCESLARTTGRGFAALRLRLRKLHADDTPVPVLVPGTGKTKTGRLWTYVRDDRPAGDQAAPAVWFAYSPDRASGAASA